MSVLHTSNYLKCLHKTEQVNTCDSGVLISVLENNEARRARARLPPFPD